MLCKKIIFYCRKEVDTFRLGQLLKRLDAAISRAVEDGECTDEINPQI